MNLARESIVFVLVVMALVAMMMSPVEAQSWKVCTNGTTVINIPKSGRCPVGYWEEDA